MKLFLNPREVTGEPYPESLTSIISLAAHQEAQKQVQGWPGYSSTPLVAATRLAQELDLGEVWIKDESVRFGLGSFKALGGAYGVRRVLDESASPSDVRVVCASDGNHGRSVAWGAQLFGCPATIYLPGHVTESRAAAIRAYGATVVRVDGEYDDAVSKAASDAEQMGSTVVSDTSYPGYDLIPRHVMQGYTVMVEEAAEELRRDRPSHTFLQGGVGGLAAAVVGHLWERDGPERPRAVVVEPTTADGLYESVRAGRPTPSRGSLHTIMAGLSCREVSPLAWRILELGVHAFMTVDDDGVPPLMRRLARGEAGEAIEAGESGVAGLLGLIAASQDPEARQALGLTHESRVLIFNTEGATDPELYAQILSVDD